MRRDEGDTDDNRSTRAAPRFLLCAALIAAAAGIAARWEEAKRPPRLEDRVTWREPEEAARIAESSQRPVLLFFSDEAALSERLEREVFGDREGALRIDAKFVLARIIDRRAAGGKLTVGDAELVKRFGIAELPALVAVEPSGAVRVFSRYPGRERALAFLRAVR
jgi:hypothetical protein